MKVAKITYWFFIFQFLFTQLDHGQTASEVNMKTIVTIDKSQSRFDDLLNSVSAQAGVVFSFSTKKISSNKLLKLNPGTQTLETFLNQIKNSTGFYYKIVGKHIIFLDRQPPVTKKSSINNNAKSTDSKAQTPAIQLKERRLQPLSSVPASAHRTTNISPKDSFSRVDSTSEIDREKGLQERDTLVAKPATAPDSVYSALHDSIQQKNNHSIPNSQKSSDTSKTFLRSTDSTALPSLTASKRKQERTPSKLKWFAGGEVSMITNAENRSEKLKATGFGFGIKMEKTFSRRFSWTLGAHLNYFTGTYTYTSFTSGRDSTVTNFAFVPVLLGLKYYPLKKWYVSFETGALVKASRMIRTKLMVAPSAGVLLPLKNSSSIDVGIRYAHVVRGFATLETPGLHAGGYGFLSVRVAYGIQDLALKFGRK